ncbi:cyclic nucleotide-binding domain-containing protein [Hymenobacter sp. RP-2-7]|uniref:histidine kinase n=1 Tax=Hymenobacter polaris TaxID=2682546 RepID=A0A7Y0ADL5_9BACT|nr:ATP-binding protein [Hymenobacter polaris]NML65403.1 cyclic nucleotide-binding domain-containing protein [Hymenobacter polaris]
MPQLLPPNPAALGSITAFQNLPSAVLGWLSETGQLQRYAAGETVVRAGEAADRLLAVVAGSVHYFRPEGGEVVFRTAAGSVSGVLPYSRLQVFKGRGVAEGDTVLFTLPRSQFAALEQLSPELVQRLVSLMNDRARDEVRGQERDDKLRALGKLSAGLSHELNNPAAAIGRAAAGLAEALAAKPLLLQNLLATCPPAEAVAALTALAAWPAEPAPALPALARADLEEELADWLETQGCPDGYALAPTLREAGLGPAALGSVAAQLPAPARPPALAWLAGQLAALRLAHDIHEASQRISQLVSNVKTYTHMDRAGGRELLAVTAGLDSTLNMFAYPLRQQQVRLSRAYAPGLPQVLGQAGSLNQVWTNLIDNALDALPAQGGQLTVRADQLGGQVRVQVEDNGSGIAPEVLPHIFEPFYTTKPPGEGTGQGLEIAYRIVQEHGGRLEVASAPGCTVFTVWLPAQP